jgi:CubicO group peptidase (beta-lactamase class C family)
MGVCPTLSCNSAETTGPSALTPEARPAFGVTLSSYFPPSEANGGWRKTTNPDNIRALGMSPDGISALGAYAMSLPWQNYNTGVSGYSSSNKASLVIKNGWIVGERYNQASARNAVYYLASNGKTFAIMLMGRLLLDYPGLGLSLSSRLYDSRWLPQGFPLSDSRKSRITLDHVFGHVSGIVPEVEADIAGRAVTGGTNWNFAPFTVGQDAEWKVSAPLYFNPGDSSTYTKGRPYSSVSFNHLSLIFRSVTGMEPSLYLRSGMLDRIGVGRMDYIRPSGMGEYRWAAGGNGLASARDYARLMYLLLHEGNWNGKRIFTAAWIRNFTGKSKYYNLRSNVDCYWGKQYPSDLYWSTGSGLNIAFIAPSLDLVATLNGRFPNTMRGEVTRTFLQKLFASVTEQYITCDGRVVNGNPAQTPPTVTALTLMNADNDQPIRTLTNGLTITLADLPTRNLNVRAVTSPGTIGSVRFGLDANANYRMETSAPYALAGDDTGNYRPWTPTVGAHTVKATPYAGANGTGTVGATLTVGFTVK